MRYGISLLALVFALGVSTASLQSQGRGKAPKAPKAPKTTTTVKTKAPKTESVQVKAPKAAKTTTATSTSASTTMTTPTGEVTPTTPTTTRVKNPKLEARLLKMLPGVTDIGLASQDFKNWGQFVAAVHASNRIGIPFETLKAKMTGITPVPAGTTGTPVITAPMSLGQAVKSLKGTTTTTTTTPTTGTLSATQIQTEVKRAEDAATADLRRTRESN